MLSLCLVALVVLIGMSHATAALYKNASPSHNVRMRQGVVLEQAGLAPYAADTWGTAAAAQGLPVETRLDIYTCNDNNANHGPSTLLVFAVDGPLTTAATNSSTQQQLPVGTQALTTFARHLAQRGLVVVVAEKRNPAFHANVSSFVALDFLRVISYMQSGAWKQIDEEEPVNVFQDVVIGGHGMGGKMAGYAVSHVSPSIYASDDPAALFGISTKPYHFNNEDLATFALVKAAFWYGSSGVIFMESTGQTDLDPTLKGGSGVPFFMIFGADDEENYASDDQRGWKTYQQWDGGENGNAKAFLVLQGLDHHGITDFPITSQQNTIVGKPPVAEARVNLVVESVIVWINTVLEYDEESDDEDESSDGCGRLDDFCQDVILALGASNVEICLPEYKEEQDLDNTKHRLGMQVGGPFIAFGVLMVAFLAMFLKEGRSTKTHVIHHDGGRSKSRMIMHTKMSPSKN